MILSKEKVEERDAILKRLESVLLDYSYYANSISGLERLVREGMIIRVRDDGIDEHDYLIKVLPEIENL